MICNLCNDIAFELQESERRETYPR